MEIPIYYSFSEFQKKYNNDFKKWKKTFADGTEKFFLEELETLYSSFCTGSRMNYVFEDTIRINYWVDGFYQNYDLSLFDYVREVQSLYTDYLTREKIEPKNEFEFKTYLTYEVFENPNSTTDYNTFLRYKPFIKFEKSWLSDDHYLLTPDKVKFKNFGFSCIQILNMIAEKLSVIEPIKSIIIGDRMYDIEPKEEVPINGLKFYGNQTEFVELVKALIENDNLRGTQKDLFEKLSNVFQIEINNHDKLISDIKHRNNGSETLFLDRLKKSMNEYIIKDKETKNTR